MLQSFINGKTPGSWTFDLKQTCLFKRFNPTVYLLNPVIVFCNSELRAGNVLAVKAPLLKSSVALLYPKRNQRKLNIEWKHIRLSHSYR